MSLFAEFATNDYPSFFTLADKSTSSHVSVKEKYMEYADPTEYRVAMALLGSYDHWNKLCGLPWFKSHVARWRTELAARIQSEAVAKTQEIAQGTGTAALTAAKWMAVRGWEGVPSKRGRPGKHEVTKEAKRLAEQKRAVAGDAERIKLHG